MLIGWKPARLAVVTPIMLLLVGATAMRSIMPRP